LALRQSEEVNSQHQRDSIFKMKIRKPTSFSKDGRRKHHHWQVTVSYKDGEQFARVYTDRKKASVCAERQEKSSFVKSALVTKVS
jgi:hypothetical protein